MKSFKVIISAILIIATNIVFAQYNELSDQDLILRMWKTYNYTQNNDDNIIKLWLSIFDKKNYSSYAQNEFLLHDKIDQTKQNIQQRLDNMQNPAIYYIYDSRSFDEYDFSLQQYKFNPFSNLTTEKHFVYTLLWNDKLFNTNIKIVGLDFVNGIPMSKSQAEQFLNKRQQKNIWGQTYNNRTVYLKIFYYNDINDKFLPNSDDAYHQYIKCTPLLVQAFGDKNYSEFICEWWNPTITNYYKQQLIQNNIPRGFFESLNQPFVQNNNTDQDSTVSTFDRDGDGVPDHIDKCPDVAGTSINKGCPELKKEIKHSYSFVARNIQFESKSSVIKPTAYIVLDEVVDVLNEYKYYNINIDGYVDNSEAINGNELSLSQARAKAAYNYIVNKGISPLRCTVTGYGSIKPIADNNTSSGRAQNRRVEFNLIFK